MRKLREGFSTGSCKLIRDGGAEPDITNGTGIIVKVKITEKGSGISSDVIVTDIYGNEIGRYMEESV